PRPGPAAARVRPPAARPRAVPPRRPSGPPQATRSPADLRDEVADQPQPLRAALLRMELHAPRAPAAHGRGEALVLVRGPRDHRVRIRGLDDEAVRVVRDEVV